MKNENTTELQKFGRLVLILVPIISILGAVVIIQYSYWARYLLISLFFTGIIIAGIFSIVSSRKTKS